MGKKFNFNEPLVSIPISGSYMKAIKRGSRQGTIGGEILSRLNTTFDYRGNNLYITRGNRYKEKFEFNMSGMSLGVVGDQLDSIKVVKIQENSPAEEVGIQPGDFVLKINGKSLHHNSFTEINSMLRSKEGRKIRVLLLRDDKKFKLKFRLRRLI